jgi:hypothetical protein
MYRLVFENQRPPRDPFVAGDRPVSLGRDSTCDLRLIENGVADRHAIIEAGPDGFHIRDLGSANRVRVNGQVIADHRLVVGDELEIGAVRLRFEMAHAAPQTRRKFDLMLWAAGVVIVLVLVGQAVVFHGIFSERRPKKMKMEAGKFSGNKPTEPEKAPPSVGLPPPSLAPLPPSRPPEVAQPAPAALNRMIQIVGISRVDAADGITLRIQAKARVASRDLDPKDVAVTVDFVVGTETRPVRVAVPAPWENFTTKSLTAHWAGTPALVRGYVVRTFYRKQLQDVQASSPELVSGTSTPSP